MSEASAAEAGGDEVVAEVESPDPDSPDEEASEEEPSGTSAEAAYPVTIEHARGTTTIEERPERIVTLNVQWTDAVLAMGVEPVAYTLSAGTGELEPYPWQEGLLDNSTRIDTAGPVPFEAIAALEPDLILVTFLAREEADLATLDEIAPTIGLLGDLQVDPWQAHVETMGMILGEPDRATEVIAEVETSIADTAAELPGLNGATYTLSNYVPGDGIYVIADPNDGASQLFAGLGMEIQPKILELDTEAIGRVKISPEEIGLLDADMLAILLNGTEVESVTGLGDLAAAQNDTLITFELADIVGLNTPTPISVPYLVDVMRPTLEKVGS